MILSSIHFKSNIKYLIHHVRLSVGHKEYIHLSIPTLARQTDMATSEEQPSHLERTAAEPREQVRY